MTIQPFHWDAQEYARFSSAQFAWAQELIDKLHLQPNERVLDIGCGDGKVTALIAGSVPAGFVTGIDRSWEMVALARDQFCRAPANIPNLAFAQMDAQALSFAPAFDAAFSNAVLHWVPDHRAALAGAARSLRPGGRLLFQMGGQGNAADIVAAMDSVRSLPAWADYFRGFAFPYRFYGPEEYAPMLEQAGLTPHRVDILPKDMQHTGREGLAGWVRTTWLPFTARVPEERREDFINAVLDLYLTGHPLDAQGKAHVAMSRLEVEAVKG